MKKNARQIMEIFEALDATECVYSAAQLAGVDPKTVRRYARMRDMGLAVDAPIVRPKMIDPFMPKIEEWVERSQGRVRADKLHERLQMLGFTGDERSTRRAVAKAKERWNAGHRRTYRPWITEPGLWCQFDWGWGPKVPGPGGEKPRETLLFCAWLAWSRYRVVIPTWDRTLPTLISCIDSMLRAMGGAPTYALTDNEKTVTIERVAGVAVRHPRSSRPGVTTASRSTPVFPLILSRRAARRPRSASRRPTWCPRTRTCGASTAASPNSAAPARSSASRSTTGPTARPARPRPRCWTSNASGSTSFPRPRTLALGESRQVLRDQTVRFGSVRYSTPPGLVGSEAWVRADGDELVVVADLSTLAVRPDWMQGPAGLAEVARHPLSMPGRPVIDLSHYPDHPQNMDGSPRPPKPKPVNEQEKAFLELGPGAKSWLIEASAAGTTRIRVKMAAAVELAALVSAAEVDIALGLAATAGRFDEGDLMSIVQHRRHGARPADLVVADEAHSVQPGTSAWAGFGRKPT
ncbi:IS21 family transposase [Streptomyces olivoreticuli]|nr:IS21 family transposase [Streptomyces olivoreticuli]WKK23826.1 IS21 family transposase [Streptomyces olivoreticuli]